MSATYQCAHHGQPHHTYAELSLLHCGHDGRTHLACHPRPAPPGTPRPPDWPEYLAWVPAVPAGVTRPWYDCACVQYCDQDPATSCSHSGEWHQHEQEPCPVHPSALMTG
jgi:hypothetical protein